MGDMPPGDRLPELLRLRMPEVLPRKIPESAFIRAGGFFADGRIGFCATSGARGDATVSEGRSKLFVRRGDGPGCIGAPGGAAKDALLLN